MTKAELIRQINSFLVTEFGIAPAQLQPAAVLRETLDLDSIDYVNLFVVIESNFGFRVSPDEMAQILTLGEFYEYCFAKMNSDPNPA